MDKHNNFQRGAVSIFIVVFSTLFVTIITVSFVSLMVRGQQQATNADLSNSAYDSALAGVEDAKRVLLQYRQCIQNNFAGAGCSTLRTLFDNPECDMVRQALTGNTDGKETLIKSTSSSDQNSKLLDQAYTCVTIDYEADEKEVQLLDGESIMIPIDSNGVGYDTISVSWFTNDQKLGQGLALPTDNNPLGPDLPTKAAWLAAAGANNTRPPILRAQLVQHSKEFNLTDFDGDVQVDGKTTANAKTTFLYPSSSGSGSISSELLDERSATPPNKAPVPIACSVASYNQALYACNVDIRLPDPINNTGSRTAYLQLGAIYNSTKVRIALKSGSDTVQMVAPTVDSTGRANDLFRRVKVGVSFTGEYPRANFEVQGNVCKDFAVSTDEFIQGSCNPNNP